jgi:Tol biopolymer transport system component
MRIRPATLVVVFALAACQSPAGTSSAPSRAEATAAASSGTILFGRYVPSADEHLIFTIKTDGSDERQILLPGSNGGAAFSPDGTKLRAFADNDQGLLFVGIANADGTDWTILHSPDPTLNLGCSAWSPDNARLACEGWDDADPGRTGIYTVRAADGSDLVRVTTTPAGFHDLPLAYTPDGALLFARDNLDGVTPGTNLVVNLDGTGLRELPVHYGGGYQWTGDGTAIVAGKAGTLFILDAAGENRVPIRIEPLSGYESGFAFAPLWSPDGRQIAFSYMATDQSPPDLFMMNRDGSGLTQLTSTTDDEEAGGWTQ